jgi:hypothetical protein
MHVSRRRFVKTAVSSSTLGIAAQSALLQVSSGAKVEGYRPNLLPARKEVWDWQVWMAKLGPKYTGNAAHNTFVEFLAAGLKESGLDLERERYTFPRWDARRSELTITPAAGTSFSAPVTSYFPYSGTTSRTGITGELVYAGHHPEFNLSGLQGKIVLVDFATSVRKFGEMYQPWGIYPTDARFPAEYRPARGAINDLVQFRKAGAAGVILAWTDISDANAADQYTPFSRPIEDIPGLYVGRETGAKLKSLASAGANATLVLEAEIHPDTPTETLIATLPGVTSDEVIIVNTHTDGPNATEENGGLGILALAKYFAKIPKAERKRTLVLPLTTGHFALPWVPSMRGVIEKHPEMIRRAVAALTVEHLGCTEWADDAQWRYRATGENEWAVAITEHGSTGRILVDALQGSSDRKTAVVNPVHGGWLGEGAGLARAGVPTIGYIPQPNYLLAGPADGCIEKLSAERLHSEIEVFAKVIHAMDSMTAADLKKKG